MMKKFLALALAVVMLLALVPVAAQADAQAIPGTNLTWELVDGTLTISGTGAMADYSRVQDLPWGSQRASITNVEIQSGVTSIGNAAFRNCSKLTSIEIPDSVVSIGDYAMFYCSWLTSVTIPDSVTSIGNNAFNNCADLTSITIPDSVTSIGNNAFAGCDSLTSVTIPDSVTSIGDGAFRDSGLTSVEIPNSVTSIGGYAFASTRLTSVTIPDSVTSIGDGAFRNTGLTSVTIPDSVTSIGERAFDGCSGLTSVTVPDSVTSIGKNIISACSRMSDESVEIATNSIVQYNRVKGLLIDAGVTENQIKPFGGQKQTITINNVEHGTVTANPTEAFIDEEVELSITPDEGYELDTVTVKDKDGNPVTVDEDNKFVMPEGGVEVIVTFEKPKQPITIGDVEHGTVTANPTEAAVDEEVELSITPDEGYELDTVTVKDKDGNPVPVDEDNKFVMPEGGVEVVVTFKEKLNADANIIGMNGFFADYFVLNLYVQTDVENPTFIITRNVSGEEETLEEMSNRTDFANNIIATYTVDKVVAGKQNKIKLTNVSGKECWMISIKFFTRYLNDDIVLSMKNGDDVMYISSVVLSGMDDTTIGIGDAVPEQSYSFIDYVSAYAKAMGESSPYYKLYAGLKLAAEGAKALG